MTDETRVHISIKIPMHLHDLLLSQVAEGRYKDKTACVTVALEKELCNTHQATLNDTGVLRDRVTEIQKLESVLQEKHAEIEGLKAELIRASNPIELAQLRIRTEEKDRQLEDKNRYIETLKKELEISQETHKNYMLQMQTLITQKQIEAPGAKRAWWRFW